MARTQEERRAETRAQLLAAAADLFAHKGFHATSAEAVADAANRTTGALYDHFGGKQGLLVALLELWVGQTIVDLGTRVEAESDLDGRLGEVWRGLIRHDNESGGAWLLLEFELWLHAAREPELGVVGAARLEAMREGFATGLTQWSTDFAFDLPAPAPQLAVQLIALLLGAAFQYRLEPATVTDAIVLDGLRRLLGLPAGDAHPYDARHAHPPIEETP
jgi:AcrR family transcriptional regulator